MFSNVGVLPEQCRPDHTTYTEVTLATLSGESLGGKVMQAVNWEKLAQISELADYFTVSPPQFQQEIEQHWEGLQTIDPTELDHLAILRMLEVTNGCIQHGFRRQDDQCLSVEQTRECMRQVIGFIQTQTIEFPSGDRIQFSPPIQTLIQNGRVLYRRAFKENIAAAERQYYAYSTAQFITYGKQRLEAAMQRVQDEFESLFTPYYIDQGCRYVAPYLAAL